MSSELSHGSSWLINHPLLLPAAAASSPPLIPAAPGAATAVPCHLLQPCSELAPACLPLPELAFPGLIPRPNAEGFSPCGGTGHGQMWSSSGRGGWSLPGVEDAAQDVQTRDLLHQGHSSCFCSRDTGSAPKQADKCSLFSEILMIFLMTRPGSGGFCWAISGSYNCT